MNGKNAGCNSDMVLKCLLVEDTVPLDTYGYPSHSPKLPASQPGLSGPSSEVESTP